MCDLSQSETLAALSLPAGWERKTYTHKQSSVCILQAQEPADILSIPLKASGWQEIRLGIFRPHGADGGMQVKLSTEPCWRTVFPMIFFNHPGGALQDVVLGVFNLSTESCLLVRPLLSMHACIAYARCRPAQPTTTRTHRKNVGAIIDGFMIMHQYGIEGPDDLEAVVHSFADSDIDRLCWGTAAGTFRALYFSEVTEYLGQGQTQFSRPVNEIAARTMANFAACGKDPLRVIIDRAHKDGLQLWADHRICHAFPPGAYADYFANPFMLENQDKRVLEFDGTPHFQACISIAYPEFRDWTVRFLTEQAKMGVDGIHIDFTRKYPLVGWEPAVYDSFKKKYGKDPKTWKGSNKDWLGDWYDHLASFVTQLMRDLRQSIRAVEADLGRCIPISVQIPHSGRVPENEWRHSGLDFSSWAKEDLVDVVTPSDVLWYREISLDHYAALLDGTKCELWGCIHQRSPDCYPPKPGPGLHEAWVDPWRISRGASDYYNQGASGVYLWEAGTLPTVLQRWEVLKNLGDREALRKEFGRPLGPYDGRHHLEQIPLS